MTAAPAAPASRVRRIAPLGFWVAALSVHGRAQATPPISTWGSSAPRADDAAEPALVDGSTAGPVHTTGTSASREDDTQPERTTPLNLHYTIESVEIAGNTRTKRRIIMRYVPFKPGTVLDLDDPHLEACRLDLLGTGFFQEVTLSLRRGTARGHVILVVKVQERNTIVVQDLWLGLSKAVDASGKVTPLTAFAGIDVAEQNLGGTGIAVSGATAVALGQLALRARVADRRIFGSDSGAYAEVLFNHAQDYLGIGAVQTEGQAAPADDAVLRYDRLGGILGVTRPFGASHWHGDLSYRLESIDATMPAVASEVRDGKRVPIDFALLRGSSVLSVLRGVFVYNTRDAPVLTRSGTDFALEFSLAPRVLGSDYAYAKITSKLEQYIPLPHDHSVRLSVFGTAISGVAPVFERVYVGDLSDFLPDRMLDLAVDRRRSPNLLNTAVGDLRYGTYVVKAALEYRIPVYRGTRSIYGIDAFASGGAYVLASDDTFKPGPSDKRGQRTAGVYTGASRFPADLTFNLGFRVDTAAGAAYIGLSTWLALLPYTGDGR